MAKSFIPSPVVAGNPSFTRRSIFRNCPYGPPPNSSSVPRRLSLSPLPKDNSVISQLRIRRAPAPVLALDSDVPRPRTTHKSEVFVQWDSLTAKFAGASNIPFLVLQMPQIILNARNLLAGNKAALLAVPWLGMFTGLLGNLSLLSYFVKKRETEAVVVQTLGVVSLYVVFVQLAMAEAMPLPYFVATSVVVAAGLVLNFLNCFEKLNASVWFFWEDFITVCGVSALPQVYWIKLGCSVLRVCKHPMHILFEQYQQGILSVCNLRVGCMDRNDSMERHRCLWIQHTVPVFERTGFRPLVSRHS